MFLEFKVRCVYVKVRNVVPVQSATSIFPSVLNGSPLSPLGPTPDPSETNSAAVAEEPLPAG